MTEAERQLRDMWSMQGVSTERQNEIIRQVEAKARSGTRIGPWVLSTSEQEA
jgi:hypothetical protein